MDPAPLPPGPMGLATATAPLDERFAYDADENILFCNFEGLVIETSRQADDARRPPGRRASSASATESTSSSTTTTSTWLPAAEPAFFAMIDGNERYVLSRTRYSTNAFFRRRLGDQFTAARLEHRLYGNYTGARQGITS